MSASSEERKTPDETADSSPGCGGHPQSRAASQRSVARRCAVALCRVALLTEQGQSPEISTTGCTSYSKFVYCSVTMLEFFRKSKELLKKTKKKKRGGEVGGIRFIL